MSGEHRMVSELEKAQPARRGTRVTVPEDQGEQGQRSAWIPLATCSAFCAWLLAAAECSWILRPPATSLSDPPASSQIGAVGTVSHRLGGKMARGGKALDLGLKPTLNPLCPLPRVTKGSHIARALVSPFKKENRNSCFLFLP